MQKFFAWAVALKYLGYLCDAHRQGVGIQFPKVGGTAPPFFGGL